MNGPITISYWYRMDAATPAGTFPGIMRLGSQSATTGANVGWGFFRTGNMVYKRGNNQPSLFAAMNVGQWYHLALRWDGNTTGNNTLAFLNGNQVTFAAVNGWSNCTATTVFELGRMDAFDTATLDEAMFRMAHANTSDARFGTVTALAAVHMPGDVTLLAKHVVLTELIDAEAATVLQGYWVVRQYCSATSVRDANRQQTCAALADVLATKGTSLLDVSVGLMLGELVGWSPERVQAVSDERDAMMQIGVKSQPEPRHAWSCDALGKTTRDLTELGQYGEVGSLRRALRQSGESVAELARRQREALAAFNAAAAASAAASAP